MDNGEWYDPKTRMNIIGSKFSRCHNLCVLTFNLLIILSDVFAAARRSDSMKWCRHVISIYTVTSAMKFS